MDVTEFLNESFGRVSEGVHHVMDGLGPDALGYRPDTGANSIAWLIWHATRVQDDHLAELVGREQRWTAAGWATRSGLPFDDADTGFGHGPEQVEQVGAMGAQLLTGYHDDVHEQLDEDLASIVAAGLDRIVDERWDPPVTAGVRLVSVVDDATKHLGQADYVRGLYERRDH